MKRKDYEKLLDKIWLADRAFSGWRSEYDDYDEIRQPLSKKEAKEKMDEAKKVLDGYKAELEDILTVDMETFAEDILKYINETHEKEYELRQYNIKGEKLWVAKPIGKIIMDTNELIDELEDTYVLGKGDKKVLPLQYFEIGNITFPTMHVNNKCFDAYLTILGLNRFRYDKFDDFMEQYEDKLVEAYAPKKKNKR